MLALGILLVFIILIISGLTQLSLFEPSLPYTPKHFRKPHEINSVIQKYKIDNLSKIL